MNNLPSLVLAEIFSNFSLREKIRLKQVCKGWKFELDAYKPTNLQIHRKQFIPNIQWSVTNDINKYENSFSLSNTNEFDLIASILVNLKRLFIYQIESIDNFEIIITKLNQFGKLEQLELHTLTLNKFEIKLKNLRILSLSNTYFDELELITPNLETLVCFENIGNIKFSNLDQIKYLFLQNYSSDVMKFVNLEYLLCTIFESVESNLLETLTKLKKIQFNCRLEDGNINNLVANELKRQKNLFKRNDLEIIDFCFDRSLITLSNEYFSINATNVEYVKRTYDRLPLNLQWTFEIDYQQLIQTFKPITKDFFRKFISIEAVVVKGKVNEFELFEFLKRCHSLYWIWTEEANLEQEFFNRLYELKSLEIISLNESVYRIIDYNFLNKSPILNKFEIFHPYLPIRFLENCLRKVKNLEVFSFCNHKFFSTERAEPNVNIAIYKTENQAFKAMFQSQIIYLKTDKDVLKFLNENELTKIFIKDF